MLHFRASFAVYLARERESQIKKLVNISGGHPRPLKTCCCSLYRLPICCFNMCGDYLRRGFMAYVSVVTHTAHTCITFLIFRLAFSESPPSDDATLAYHLTPAMLKYIMRGQVRTDEHYIVQLCMVRRCGRKLTENIMAPSNNQLF